MDSHYETIKTQATPEYILDIFKDWHRLTCDFGECFTPDLILTMDLTIKDWRNAEDLLEWKPLGKALNNYFGVSLDDEEWKSLLEPESQKTLRGVCERIAKEIYQEQIKLVSIMGKSCLKGGIFLTIRSKLAEAGASVEELSPSSDLAPYAKNHLRVFLEISSKLFPGKFPNVMIHNPYSDFAFSGFLVSILLTILGGIIEHFVDPAGAFLTIFGVLGVIISSLVAPFVVGSSPKSVEFGNLKTFRSLVNYISEPQASGS